MIESYSSYSFLLDRTARRVKQYAQRRFRELGMNVTVDQWMLIKQLSEHDGMNQRQLSEVLFKDTPTLTRIIDLLEQKGYVERIANPEDRRCFKIILTVAGKNKVAEYQDQVKVVRKEAWRGLNESDFEQFRKVLNTIYKNVE